MRALKEGELGKCIWEWVSQVDPTLSSSLLYEQIIWTMRKKTSAGRVACANPLHLPPSYSGASASMAQICKANTHLSNSNVGV